MRVFFTFSLTAIFEATQWGLDRFHCQEVNAIFYSSIKFHWSQPTVIFLIFITIMSLFFGKSVARFAARTRASSNTHCKTLNTVGRNPRFCFSTKSDSEKEGPLLDKISVIGAGMMAQAIVEPLVNSGVQPAEQVCVYDVSDKQMEFMNSTFGTQTAQTIDECLVDTDLVILAVKPQNLTDSFFGLLQNARPNAKENAIMLSIIAGTPIDTLRQGSFQKVVRSMPNTPATIGQGMTTWVSIPGRICASRFVFLHFDSMIMMVAAFSSSYLLLFLHFTSLMINDRAVPKTSLQMNDPWRAKFSRVSENRCVGKKTCNARQLVVHVVVSRFCFHFVLFWIGRNLSVNNPQNTS